MQAETETRTGNWDKVFAAGTAVIAGLATVMAREKAAYADCQNSPCCDLARCNGCPPIEGHPFAWSCPSGYMRTSWTCVWGGRHHVECGECQKGGNGNCFNGSSYACSIWFEIN